MEYVLIIFLGGGLMGPNTTAVIEFSAPLTFKTEEACHQAFWHIMQGAPYHVYVRAGHVCVARTDA